MVDKFLYRVVPAAIAIFIALLLLPATSAAIRQAMNEWFVR
jgi:hypothetical protein